MEKQFIANIGKDGSLPLPPEVLEFMGATAGDVLKFRAGGNLREGQILVEVVHQPNMNTK